MLLATFGQYFFGLTIFISSIFLIMLVLVQRGRGGGLTGALGGPGGQSAFGTKAGDVFTRITIGVAAFWIFLCASAVFFLRPLGLPQISGDRSAGFSANAPAGDVGGGLPLDSSSGTTTPPVEPIGDSQTQAEATQSSPENEPSGGSPAATDPVSNDNSPAGTTDAPGNSGSGQVAPDGSNR